MLELYDQISQAKHAVQGRWSKKPQIGIILGTGLGGLTEDIEEQVKIPYEEIPHFPASTVESHAGRLVCGTLSGKAVLEIGRAHV